MNQNVFDKIIAENSLNAKKEIDIKEQEKHKVINRMNPHINRSIPRHMVFKIPKFKEDSKISKRERKKKKRVN